MNELLLNNEKLTTADVANPERIHEVHKVLVGDRTLEPLPQDPSIPDIAPLFPENELQDFRARWDQVQISFVDEPRQAVEKADNLVANVVKRIAEQYSAQRERLDEQWDSGDDVSTEDLRLGLRRYRSLFDRLLTF